MPAALEVKSNVEVAAGSTLTFQNQDAILTFDHPDAHNLLTINGTVAVGFDTTATPTINPTGGLMGVYSYYGDLHIGTTGQFSLTSSATLPAFGFYNVSGTEVVFINDGRFEVTGANVQGMRASTQIHFENNGTFRVSGAHVVGAEGSYSIFENTGHFEASGGPSPVGVSLYGIRQAFDNSGDLRAVSNGAGFGTAVIWQAQDSSFTNSGLIEGDTALVVRPPSSSPSFQTQLFTNTGTIHGAMTFNWNMDLLDNSRGTIVGDVDLGAGADTYSAAAGVMHGALHGGAGDDVIMAGGGSNYLRGDDGVDRIVGGSDFDDINGNAGDDTASGGLGDDWVVGGKDNDSLSGGAGGDVVWGNLGNDTQEGGDGDDQVRGGQGDDSVSGGAGNDYVSGDRGADTISGGTGADLFHGSQDAGIDRVLDFNSAEGDRVFLDPGTTYTLSQVGADTVIDMGGGHQMILVGIQLSTLTAGWIFGA